MAPDRTGPDEAQQISAADQSALRAWFEAHHDTEVGVWLVYWKAGSGHPSVTRNEAVDVALCFGWIDSRVRGIDEDRYRQWFSPRKPAGDWSRINKEKIERLTAEGRMAPAGLEAVAVAKANGSWRALEASDALIVPDDLADALDRDADARHSYEGYPEGVRRGILEQVYGAKRSDTRQRRIAAVVEAAGRNERPFGL
jgi:uncharacterized protein YdeI (YjbR/CyaY-like superfamily)